MGVFCQNVENQIAPGATWILTVPLATLEEERRHQRSLLIEQLPFLVVLRSEEGVIDRQRHTTSGEPSGPCRPSDRAQYILKIYTLNVICYDFI